MVNEIDDRELNPEFLQWTGERMHPDQDSYGNVEHLHRYSLVSKYLTENMVVLDAACGEGYGTFMISKHVRNVVGVDISIDTIEHAKMRYKNSNIQFINASATAIPLEAGLFDVIVSFETIEHLEEQEELIREFKRLLKSDGLLIISTPDKEFFSKNYPNPFHVKELNFVEFKSLLNKFFPSLQFLFQKTVHGSIIYNSELPCTIEQFSGEFENISQNASIKEPEFVIALASPTESYNQIISNSLFDASLLYEKELMKNKINETKYMNLISSRKFRFLNRILKNIGCEFDL